jgi:hypothetical protein
MNYEQMTAPRGLPCFNCVAYLANENQEMRNRISQEFGIPSDALDDRTHQKGLRKISFENCRSYLLPHNRKDPRGQIPPALPLGGIFLYGKRRG